MRILVISVLSFFVWRARYAGAQKIKATKTYVDEYVRQILIPISTEVLQQNKTYIMGVINRYGNDKIFIKGSNLIITYDSRDTSEKNVEIYQEERKT